MNVSVEEKRKIAVWPAQKRNGQRDFSDIHILMLQAAAQATIELVTH